MGTSGLGRSSVSGRKRVPSPAPRTNACVMEGIALTIRHGGRTRLARQLLAMEELWLFSSTSDRRHRHPADLCRGFARDIFTNKKLLPVHLVPPGGANLYRAGALSPNEMQSLRADERATEKHGRGF